MSGSATAFAPGAGVIRTISSILLWVSAYTAYSRYRPTGIDGNHKSDVLRSFDTPFSNDAAKAKMAR